VREESILHCPTCYLIIIIREPTSMVHMLGIVMTEEAEEVKADIPK